MFQERRQVLYGLASGERLHCARSGVQGDVSRSVFTLKPELNICRYLADQTESQGVAEVNAMPLCAFNLLCQQSSERFWCRISFGDPAVLADRDHSASDVLFSDKF